MLITLKYTSGIKSEVCQADDGTDDIQFLRRKFGHENVYFQMGGIMPLQTVTQEVPVEAVAEPEVITPTEEVKIEEPSSGSDEPAQADDAGSQPVEHGMSETGTI